MNLRSILTLDGVKYFLPVSKKYTFSFDNSVQSTSQNTLCGVILSGSLIQTKVSCAIVRVKIEKIVR